MQEKDSVKFVLKSRDEFGEKVKVEFVSPCNGSVTDLDDLQFEPGNIRWYVKKLQEFLLACGFAEKSVERIYFLEDGEKIVDKEGNTYEVHDLY